MPPEAENSSTSTVFTRVGLLGFAPTIFFFLVATRLEIGRKRVRPEKEMHGRSTRSAAVHHPCTQFPESGRAAGSGAHRPAVVERVTVADCGPLSRGLV